MDAALTANIYTLSRKDVECVRSLNMDIPMASELRPASKDEPVAISYSGTRPRRLRAVLLSGKTDGQRKNELFYLKSKIERCKSIKHAGLTNILGLYVELGDPPILRTVSDGPECTVLDYFYKIPKSELAEYRTKACIEIAAGLDYLHSSSVVHGAIRASNILVKEDGTCCLGEFSSEYTPSEHTLSTHANWMAPELVSFRSFHNLVVDHYRREQYHGEYKTDSDMFAFGCMMYELYMGVPPPPMHIPYNKVKDFHSLTQLSRPSTEEEQRIIPSRVLTDIKDLLGYVPTRRPNATVVRDRLRNPKLPRRNGCSPLTAKRYARELMQSAP